MANTINATVCLQQDIDVISAELKCWESQLPFLIHEYGTPLSDHTMVQQDLLQFTKKMWVGRKFYFSIVKYPIDGTESTRKSSQTLLTKDLQRAALSKGGYVIISNGTRKNKSGEVLRLRCNASQVYSNKKASKKASSCDEYRRSSSLIHNDRTNTRGPADGKNMMVRRMNTTIHCAVKKELACKMFFAVSWDRAGFFFSAGNGCANHNDHIQLNRNETQIPNRLIDERLERDDVTDESCGEADVALPRGRQGALSTQHEEPPAKNMTQESVVYDDFDDDDDNCTTIGVFNDTVVTLRSNPLSPPQQPFVELNSAFKELCALYKNNCTSVELDSIQATISDLITKKRTEIATGRSLGQPQLGNLISPHVVSSKRRKTHGTKHIK
jgi:hypothetical protein